MSEETKNSPKTSIFGKRLYIAIGLVLLIWLGNMSLFIWWPPNNSGVFGDTFGASNALFSALAFALLIIALWMQKQELELQREELRETRREMEGQKLQLEGQKNQMEIQNFENRYFQLVATWGNLTDSLRELDVRGRDVFWRAANRAIENVKAQLTHTEFSVEEAIDIAMKRVYSDSSSNFTNYMRLLYNIVKLVDLTDVNFTDKKFYTNILRAQLSQAELVFIFYNCLASSYGRAKSKPLIEKYSLLKHILTEDLVSAQHRELYDKSAYE